MRCLGQDLPAGRVDLGAGTVAFQQDHVARPCRQAQFTEGLQRRSKTRHLVQRQDGFGTGRHHRQGRIAVIGNEAEACRRQPDPGQRGQCQPDHRRPADAGVPALRIPGPHRAAQPVPAAKRARQQPQPRCGDQRHDTGHDPDRRAPGIAKLQGTVKALDPAHHRPLDHLGQRRAGCGIDGQLVDAGLVADLRAQHAIRAAA